ncbi:FAD-dependent oxidoreductase [Magnetospirillum molischianum]|uniref:Rubredoxin-NAD(+) reductase n=1 Tax=Magnetospirillum molischianum DSM 120 TaxID=1150626 RepID=H8FMJ7_MAGML|nr:FAD-dependent oxidoreductase [Magnetospirillum molischianum]CCG39585.1 Rubredoxin-NAD(+) reductase [Magnetospirillum molischianum DSM 120]
MTSTADGVVIVGSGLAGYTFARELRRRDSAVQITLITADGGEAYSKPMLSAAFAQGKTHADLVQKAAALVASDLSIRVMTRHQVEMIHRDRRRLTLRRPDGTGTEIGYEQLVLAVGADPRPYRVEGSAAAGLFTVNDLDDYALWREALTPGARVLLIGAGLIGCEFANDLVTGGHAVTLVDPAPWPLGRLLPAELGIAMAAALAKAGAVLHLNRSVTAFTPGLAVLDDGTQIPFDRALTAIGLVPRTALAAAAGLAVMRGIVVDRLLRTSDPSIYALGDCAETEVGPLPYIAPLLAEAKALAATLAGTETPLALPALPVVVKTPALPTTVCPPPPGAEGHWRVEGEGCDLKALFVGPDGQPLGFALCGKRTAEARTLATEIPPLLA